MAAKIEEQRKDVHEILGGLTARDGQYEAVQEVVRALLDLRQSTNTSLASFLSIVASTLAEMEDSGGLDEATAALIALGIASGVAPHPINPEVRSDLLQLQQIVQAASSNRPLSERLPGVVSRVAAAMQMDACTLFVRDEATDILALRAACGMDPATIGAVTLQVGRGIVGQAAEQRRTVVASNAHEHVAFHNHPALADEQFASQLSSPLVVEEDHRLIGVISVHTSEPREFGDDDIEFLETVAGVLAVSIDSSRQSARTDDQLQQKIAELATLQRVSRVIASSLDLSQVLRLITEQAVELIHAEAASIFSFSEEPAAQGERRPNIEYRVGRMRSHENESARDEIVRNVLKSGAGRTRDIAYRDSVNSVFCLPLNTARETVGALCFRLREGTQLDEEQLGLLQAFGDAAAIAIDNARLYEEALTAVQTQSALVQEMHHRVRNNLQTVAALLSLQLRSEPDAAWTFELGEAVSRIQAIAGVHDLMSDESRLAGTTVDKLAQMVAEDAHSTLMPPGLSVSFVIPKSKLMVPSKQATIIALLINELTANAIHHGFKDRSSGEITITGREESGSAVIEVANDGVKISETFDPEKSDGLGMRITQRLVTSDLRGTFTIKPTDKGTLASIRFPIAQLADDESTMLGK